MRSRQKRVDGQASAATAEARRLLKALRSGDIVEHGLVFGVCEQLAACCRALGLSSQPGPLEFLHAGHITSHVLLLTACFKPVGGAAGAAPRPQDLALTEGLLQSKVLVELVAAVQRLMPLRTTGPSAAGTVDAPAWTRPVSYFGPGQQQQQRVSVAAAVYKLLLRHLTLLLRMNAWLESAAASVHVSQGESGSAASQSDIHKRLQRLQLAFATQLIAGNINSTANSALAVSPILLHMMRLGIVVTDGVSSKHALMEAPATLEDVALISLAYALPRTSAAEQYVQLAAVHGLLHASAARVSVIAEGEMEGESTLCSRLASSIAVACQHAARSVQLFVQSGLALDVSPSQALPPPSLLLAHSIRSSLWWRRRTSPAPQLRSTLHGHAFQLLATGSLQALQLLHPAAAPGTLSNESSHVTAATVAALDCLAELVVDNGKELAARMQSSAFKRARAVLQTLAGAGSDAAGGNAAFSMGAGRSSGPRCAVSAAMVLVATASAALITAGDEATERRAVVAAQCTIRIVQPTLQALLAPLAALLRAPGADAGSVLACAASKPDVAGCLAAAWNCISCSCTLPLNGIDPHHSKSMLWSLGPQRLGALLSDCMTILGSLSTWLADGPEDDMWGRDKGAWRAALQEFDVFHYAGMPAEIIKVFALATSSAAERAVCDVAFELLQLPRSAALSATLLHKLISLTYPAAGPVPPCMHGQARHLLTARAKHQCGMNIGILQKTLGNCVGRVGQCLPCAFMRLFLHGGAHQLLQDPFSPASAAVRLPWSLASGQFMALLECVHWSQPLLEAVQHVDAACEQACPDLLASCKANLHKMVVMFAAWLPLQLVQWVAAASPPATAQALPPACPPCVDQVLSDLQQALAASGADGTSIVDRLRQAVGKSEAFDGGEDLRLVELVLGGPVAPDAAAGTIGGVRFQALWGWSTAACGRLVAELRAACMAGAQGATGGDSGSGGPVQGQVDVGAAIAVVQRVAAAELRGGAVAAVL